MYAGAQTFNVIAIALHTVAAELRQILPDLRRGIVQVIADHGRGHTGIPLSLKLVQAPEITGKPTYSIVRYFVCLSGFHKHSLQFPAGFFRLLWPVRQDPHIRICCVLRRNPPRS